MNGTMLKTFTYKAPANERLERTSEKLAVQPKRYASVMKKYSDPDFPGG